MIHGIVDAARSLPATSITFLELTSDRRIAGEQLPDSRWLKRVYQKQHRCSEGVDRIDAFLDSTLGIPWAWPSAATSILVWDHQAENPWGLDAAKGRVANLLSLNLGLPMVSPGPRKVHRFRHRPALVAGPSPRSDFSAGDRDLHGLLVLHPSHLTMSDWFVCSASPIWPEATGEVTRRHTAGTVLASGSLAMLRLQAQALELRHDGLVIPLAPANRRPDGGHGPRRGPVRDPGPSAD